MEELGQKKSKAGLVIGLIVLLLAISAAAYFYQKKTAVPPSPSDLTAAAPAAVTDTTVQTPVTPATPEANNGVVVPTKKLDLGQQVTPPEVQITDPAVKAMMAPRSVGDANAPIKVDEYASLTCGHCGAFHRETYEQFKAQYIDTGKVQLTFHDFPLNQPAVDAAMILRCMPEERFVSFMNLLFQEQDKWAYADNYKDMLRQNAKLAGMNDEQFDACAANNALKEAIVGTMKQASDTYKIQSTPSFVINHGQRVLVGNQPVAEFEKAFAEVSSAGTSAPATQTPAAAPTAPAAAMAPAQTTLEQPQTAAAPDTTVPPTPAAAPIAPATEAAPDDQVDQVPDADPAASQPTPAAAE